MIISIIGIILSIIAIICGIYLILDGIVNIKDGNIWLGAFLVLINVVLFFIHFKNLGCI